MSDCGSLADVRNHCLQGNTVFYTGLRPVYDNCFLNPRGSDWGGEYEDESVSAMRVSGMCMIARRPPDGHSTTCGPFSF